MEGASISDTLLNFISDMYKEHGNVERLSESEWLLERKN